MDTMMFRLSHNEPAHPHGLRRRPSLGRSTIGEFVRVVRERHIQNALIIGLLSLLAIVGHDAQARKFMAGDSGEIAEILQNARPGDEIQLKPSASPFQIRIEPRDNLRGVRFASQNPADPATISLLIIRGGHYLTFEGLRFSGPANAEAHARTISIYASSNIAIRGSTLRGDARGPITLEAFAKRGQRAKAVNALFIREVEGFVFENNLVSHYNFGAFMQRSNNVVIRDNEISMLQGDAIQIAEVRDVLIEGNHFHDFLGTDQKLNHMDMIQMWTTHTNSPSQNVTIQSNVFRTGAGLGTQTIHMRNERVDQGQAGEELFYQNITIIDNVIYNSHLNAVNIGETSGLTIVNNTIIGNPATGLLTDGQVRYSPPSIRVSARARNVRITDNIVANVSFRDGETPNDARVSGNVRIDYDDPASQNYVGNLFINAEYGGDIDLSALRARPGGPIDGAKAGAAATAFRRAPAGLTPAFSAKRVDGATNRFRFDASVTTDRNGYVSADGAEFRWTFADGATLEGQTVERAFDGFGVQPVTLAVATSNDTARVRGAIRVRDPVLIDLQTRAGEVRDLSAYDALLTYDPSAALESGYRVRDETVLEIARANRQLFGLEKFSLAFDVRRKSRNSGEGVVAHIFKSFSLELRNDRLIFSLENSAGEAFEVKSRGRVLADTNWRRVVLTFDGTAGEAELFVDGVAVGWAAMRGNTKPPQSWGLVFGRQWGDGFEGLVDNIRVTAETISAADDFKAFKSRIGGG